jgi:hypothetical protein
MIPHRLNQFIKGCCNCRFKITRMKGEFFIILLQLFDVGISPA